MRDSHVMQVSLKLDAFNVFTKLWMSVSIWRHLVLTSLVELFWMAANSSSMFPSVTSSAIVSKWSSPKMILIMLKSSVLIFVQQSNGMCLGEAIQCSPVTFLDPGVVLRTAQRSPCDFNSDSPLGLLKIASCATTLCFFGVPFLSRTNISRTPSFSSMYRGTHAWTNS